MNPSKYSAHFLLREPRERAADGGHGPTPPCPRADRSAVLFSCCADLNGSACSTAALAQTCIVAAKLGRLSFFFFFNLAAPRALLAALRQPLPRRAPVTKHTSGFNSSLCAGLAGSALAFVLVAGSPGVNPAEMSAMVQLEKPKSIQNFAVFP